jgi:quercetin dioxygenase-like cupin family protein
LIDSWCKYIFGKSSIRKFRCIARWVAEAVSNVSIFAIHYPTRMQALERTIKHRVTGETVTFIETAAETEGAYVLIEVSLPAHGDGPPLHIHDEFEEQFECLSGRLTIRLGKDKKVLQPGEKAVAPKLTPHTFANEHDEPVTFRVKLTPPSRFEESIRFHYGLMDAGLADNKGTPKSLLHTALVLSLQNTYIAGIPLTWQRKIMQYLVKKGHKKNAYHDFTLYTHRSL